MTTTGPVAACPSCEAALPSESRFCPECGTRLGAGETIEMSPVIQADPNLTSAPPAAYEPPEVHQAHRRPFGVHPVPVLGGAGSSLFLLALILLALGSVVVGLILICLAAALFALFVGGVRRERDAPGAEATLRTVARTRSLAGLAAVSTRSWLVAGRDLLRIRHRQHRLRSELKASLAPLGEAVHNDDHEHAEALKQQAAEIERKLSEAEREASVVVAGARSEVEQERASVEATQTHDRVVPEPDGPGRVA